MRTDYTSRESFEHILATLTPENRLALIVSMTTGLRIDDVLHLRTKDVVKGKFTITEMKTHKRRRVSLSKALVDSLFYYSGRYYVFEHRLDEKKCRTRQAVFKDLKRACDVFRISEINLAPHSARKIFAVGEYQRTCKIETVKKLLNHSDEAVTMLYAMADVLTERHSKKKVSHVPTMSIKKEPYSGSSCSSEKLSITP